MNTKKQVKTPDASRAVPEGTPEPVRVELAIDPAAEYDCNRFAAAVDSYLSRVCGTKKNHLEPCGEAGHSDECACGSGGGAGSPAGKTDLIVLIDTSGSMTGIASAVSAAASEAIEKAKASCPTDLRVTYLGVDGVWPGTVFNKSHRAYLAALTTATLSTDNPPGGLDQEEGANAIEDLSKYFDWRAGACRAIFYISDEELDSVVPMGDTANEAAATAAAIAAANANQVTVFAHHLTYQNRGPSVIANYNDLCNKTGGKAIFSATATAADYVKLLTDVICNACGNKCKEAEIPVYSPCISVRWGDSECDCMETDDVEVLCVTVCNCYSNITFSNLSIGFVSVTEESGKPVAALPDGTPSVEIVPPGPLCFGDIPPCKDGNPGCVSRQVVLRTRGAKGGRYRLLITGLCYGVELHFSTGKCFQLDLCRD